MSGFFNLTQLWRSWVACRWPKCFVGFLQGACMREWVRCACIKKKKKRKKSFSLKRAEKGSVTSMKVNDASFPCPPSAPSHVLFIILEGETLAHPGIFPFQILFSAYSLQGSHWQILADWSGGGGGEESGLQFMAGEESLDSKCIWKRGAESQTRRITEAPPSCWCSHFPWERRGSGSPSSSSAGHKRFVLATSKAPGHSFRVFLNSKVCKVVAEDLGKALAGQLLLQSRMESHH